MAQSAFYRDKKRGRWAFRSTKNGHTLEYSENHFVPLENNYYTYIHDDNDQLVVSPGQYNIQVIQFITHRNRLFLNSIDQCFPNRGTVGPCGPPPGSWKFVTPKKCPPRIL